MTPGNNHFQAIRKAVEANSLKFRKMEPVQEENIPVLSDQAEDPAEREESAAAADRSRLAQLIREQRLRIKTLQSVHRDALSDLQREHRLEIQGLRSDLADLEQKYERQRLSNEQLKKRLSERNEQYLAMQEQMAAVGEEKQREDSNAGAELLLLREQLNGASVSWSCRTRRLLPLKRKTTGSVIANRRKIPYSIFRPIRFSGGLSTRRRSCDAALQRH